MKVHILYLTTACNLKCPYCYEKEKASNVKRASIEQIDSFIDSIIEEEKGEHSTLCLLGGEPLLEFDKIKYIFNKCVELQKRNLYIALNLITNGTLIHKYIDDFKYMLTSNKVHMSLDVSYDGINQYLRTGKDTVVEDNLRLLCDNNLEFGISYTITENNCDHAVLIKEVIYLLEKFYPRNRNIPNRYKSKIKLSIDLQGITKILGISDRDEYLLPIREAMKYLYSLYRIPICDVTCSLCKRCDVKKFTGKQYSVPGKKEWIDEEMVTIKKFNHF